MNTESVQIIQTGDVRLWARRDGDPARPCVILVAGANACHLMWPDEFSHALMAHGLSVIRYDHRDTGKSTQVDFDSAPYAIADLAHDIVAVLDGFSVAQAHAVGLSLGGTLVQAAVLDHPDRFRSATVMLTAALDVDFVGNIRRAYTGDRNPMGLPSPRREILDILGQRSAASHTVEEELDRRTQEWVALSGTLARVDPEEFRAWERRAIQHAGTLARPMNHGRAAPIPTERGRELAGVRTPFLVIQGGQDPLNPPPHGQHLADLIPSARLVEIAELGHSLPRSLHGALADAIATHVAAAEAAPRRS